MTAAEKKAAAAVTARDNARAAKFVTLAEKRVTKAINAIRSVSKLSNRNNYVFTDEQVTKIAEAIRGEVVEMHETFSAKAPAEKGGFVL